jgi:hypothetical protein
MFRITKSSTEHAHATINRTIPEHQTEKLANNEEKERPTSKSNETIQI